LQHWQFEYSIKKTNIITHKLVRDETAKHLKREFTVRGLLALLRVSRTCITTSRRPSRKTWIFGL